MQKGTKDTLKRGDFDFPPPKNHPLKRPNIRGAAAPLLDVPPRKGGYASPSGAAGALQRKPPPPESRQQKDLMLVLSRLADSLTSSYKNSAPNEICAYIYELAGAANKFYHDVKIISEPDEAKKASYVALMDLTRRVLETCIDLLGFSAPEKM